MRIACLLMALCLMLSGCSQDQPRPTTPAPEQPQQTPAAKPIHVDQPSVPPTVQLPEIDSSPYVGPAAVLKLLQLESFPPQCVATMEITTPTGGWTLTRDAAAVVGDTAKIFLTLEKPADGEMVTQSLVAHREEFKSSDPCFAHAEVYIHLAQRGVSTLTTNYRLAVRQ